MSSPYLFIFYHQHCQFNSVFDYPIQYKVNFSSLCDTQEAFFISKRRSCIATNDAARSAVTSPAIKNNFLCSPIHGRIMTNTVIMKNISDSDRIFLLLLTLGLLFNRIARDMETLHISEYQVICINTAQWLAGVRTARLAA